MKTGDFQLINPKSDGKKIKMTIIIAAFFPNKEKSSSTTQHAFTQKSLLVFS